MSMKATSAKNRNKSMNDISHADAQFLNNFKEMFLCTKILSAKWFHSTEQDGHQS